MLFAHVVPGYFAAHLTHILLLGGLVIFSAAFWLLLPYLQAYVNRL